VKKEGVKVEEETWKEGDGGGGYMYTGRGSGY